MSVSSHLTPEPERRLWLILESARHAAEWSDKKIGALTMFAALELIYVRLMAVPGALNGFAGLALTAVLPLGVFAFSSLTGKPRWHPFQKAAADKPRSADNLVSVDDLAKYSHGELIGRLDWYLGGGITSTQYYEDIVGQIVISARVATRKERLFRVCCFIAGAAQLALLAQVVLP
jgi:hypothetical protein